MSLYLLTHFALEDVSVSCKYVNIKHNLESIFDTLSIQVNITLEWMPNNIFDGKLAFFWKCLGANRQQAIT